MPVKSQFPERDLRSEFPLLERMIDGRPIIYLDSAATALKPRGVLEAVSRYEREFTANIHRGKHALSEEASTAYELARRKIAGLLEVPPASVIFVRNATEGINLVAHGLQLSRDDRVMVPIAEHHSNIVPWMRAANVTWLEVDPASPPLTRRIDRGNQTREATATRRLPRIERNRSGASHR